MMVVGLHARGDAVAKGGVAPAAVVEHLDVLHHMEPRLGTGGEAATVVDLVLQHRES